MHTLTMSVETSLPFFQRRPWLSNVLMVAILLLPREDPALPILILEVDITIINSVIMCHEKLRSLLKKR